MAYAKYLAQQWSSSKGVVLGLIAKLIVVVLGLENTRLLIDLIGLQEMAAHAILVSLTAWIGLLNFGMPFAVNSLISKYRAENRDYLKIKAAAITLVVILSILLMPLMLIAGVLIKTTLLRDFFNIDHIFVGLICFFILLSGLMQVLFQLLFAENQPLLPNIFPAINSCMTLIGLIILKQSDINNINLVITTTFIPNAVGFIYLILIFRNNLKFHFEKNYFYEILNNSKGYLLFAFLSASTLSVDYIIMSTLISSNEISTYNLLNRIFGIIITINSIFIINAWSKMGDRLHAGTFQIAHNKIRDLLIAGILSAIIICMVIAYFIDEIMFYLSGEIINVEILLISSFIFYMILRVWTDIFSMAVMSFNKLKIVNYYIPFQAAISIAAQYTLVKIMGLPGILLGIIISYLATAAWILPYYFYKNTKYKI